MIRAMAMVAMLLITACSKSAAPVVSDDATAIAAAERKAVADTDAARRDAAIGPAEQTPG